MIERRRNLRNDSVIDLCQACVAAYVAGRALSSRRLIPLSRILTALINITNTVDLFLSWEGRYICVTVGAEEVVGIWTSVCMNLRCGAEDTEVAALCAEGVAELIPREIGEVVIVDPAKNALAMAIRTIGVGATISMVWHRLVIRWVNIHRRLKGGGGVLMTDLAPGLADSVSKVAAPVPAVVVEALITALVT
ncbi:MAG: hypothetical protein ACYS30_20905, partial [Planctomycetota bacterium]